MAIQTFRNLHTRALPTILTWRKTHPDPCTLLFRSEKWNLDVTYLQPKAPSTFQTPRGSTYGFVVRGQVHVDVPHEGVNWTLNAGQYWSASENCIVREAVIGREPPAVFVVRKLDYVTMHAAGGPVESSGRLRYIDGCSDTVLLAPAKLGDPCLNLLCFPENVKQSRHTHPAVRVGVVQSGSGKCVVEEGEIGLEKGVVFAIPEGVVHAFETGVEKMRVVAFHPDSDCGPTDQNHPMINKTMLFDGKRE